MTILGTTETTRTHYDSVANRYGANWGDGPEGSYPANRVRWDIVRSRLRQLGVKTLLEVGCGEGSPLAVLAADGYDVRGFDFSGEMIVEAYEKDALGGRVWVGDATLLESYRDDAEIYREYDAVLALGPFPHLRDEQQAQALANCADAVKEGGRVFVELRNANMALFSLNAYSGELFREILGDAPESVKALTEQHFTMGVPQIAMNTENYGSTYSRFNRIESMPDLFAKAGLTVETIWTYHHHACPPQYETRDHKWFREASLALEWPHPAAKWPANPWGVGAHPDAWKGLYRASAVVVESVKV